MVPYIIFFLYTTVKSQPPSISPPVTCLQGWAVDCDPSRRTPHLSLTPIPHPIRRSASPPCVRIRDGQQRQDGDVFPTTLHIGRTAYAATWHCCVWCQKRPTESVGTRTCCAGMGWMGMGMGWRRSIRWRRWGWRREVGVEAVVYCAESERAVRHTSAGEANLLKSGIFDFF